MKKAMVVLVVAAVLFGFGQTALAKSGFESVPYHDVGFESVPYHDVGFEEVAITPDSERFEVIAVESTPNSVDYRLHPTLTINTGEGVYGREGISFVFAKDTKPEDVVILVNPTTGIIGVDDRKAEIVYMDGIWNCQSKDSGCSRLDGTLYDTKHKRVGFAQYKIASPAKLTVSFDDGKKGLRVLEMNL